ncbi:MAG: site-2 protease family protein [Candidatus Aminicenantes bacterium RBG_16_66_30]
MFGKPVTLFRIFGFEVKVDWSWLILGALIVWSLATGLFPVWYKGLEKADYWVMGVAGALGLFLSIVFHELWHSLIARRFGLNMRGITLFLFGGVSEMADEPPSPKAEFFLAVAGPISSVVLAAVFFAVSYLLIGPGPATPVTGVLNYLGYLNLILAAFNLIPAFPLDGGRVLRAILWGSWNDLRRATRVASSVGAGLGAGLMFFGVLQFFMGRSVGGIWTFIIGMFVRSAARSSYQQLVFRDALSGVPVKKFMVTDAVTVKPGTTVEKLVDDYIYKYHFKMYPVVDGETRVGCVTLDQVKDLPRADWASHSVGELARGCSAENTIRPDDDVIKALALMQKTGRSRLLVAEDGKLAGIISLKDIMGYIAIKSDLEEH